MREITPRAKVRPGDVARLPQVKRGDIWLLGGHRLVCGDATDRDTVNKALSGAAPRLMVTDPPYGVSYDPAWRAAVIDYATGRKPLRALGSIANDDRHDWRQAWALFPGDVAYVWHSGLHAIAVARGLEAEGFRIRAQIVWDKGRLVISRGHYHWRHESCWYTVRKSRTANWAGDRKQTTVWQIPHRRSDTGHPAQKPVECMRRPIVNHTRPGDAVYDPFLGSGSTMIAAEMTGRLCLGIELDPAHVATAIARWQELTGKVATVARAGRAALARRGWLGPGYLQAFASHRPRSLCQHLLSAGAITLRRSGTAHPAATS